MNRQLKRQQIIDLLESAWDVSSHLHFSQLLEDILFYDLFITDDDLEERIRDYLAAVKSRKVE